MPGASPRWQGTVVAVAERQRQSGLEADEAFIPVDREGTTHISAEQMVCSQQKRSSRHVLPSGPQSHQGSRWKERSYFMALFASAARAPKTPRWDVFHRVQQGLEY